MVGVAGVGITPLGPSHWKSGVPVTPLGRVTEQVRVTDSPAMTGEEGEEVREKMAGSVGEKGNSLIYNEPLIVSASNTYSDILWCSSHSTG